ncbi:MAG: ABC transporter ATP-binding protein [Anaerolineae bacterium]|nr:ABC transporter ATP-binding protein [Thermoflexales bacterium]MDW8395172.1 ABC transporter ATP-binding protein [Anaerolineae bacterium]
MSIIELRNLAKRYGRKTVLRNVSLTIEPGEFMVIYGLPVSGKSVLVRLLTGLEKPDGGQIFMRGQDVTRMPPGDRNLGYVPQSFALYPHYSVFDNIAYPLTLAGVDKTRIRAEVEQAARLLKIERFLDRRPDQLSGGQKQRVAIARGLVKHTDIFILDDPLVGLDFKLRERLIEDLKVTQEQLGVTFVYTTSEAVEAMQLAGRIAVLERGEIVEVGPPDELYLRPKRIETMRYVGFPQANLLYGQLHRRDGRYWLSTSLFEIPVHQASHAQESIEEASQAEVSVAIRPEHIRLHAASTDSAVSFQAKVLLREDLGGEEIVYLDARGLQLATVLRSDEEEALQIEIDQPLEVCVHLRDIVVYAADGRYVARGG